MALMLLPLALSHAYAPGTSTVRGGASSPTTSTPTTLYATATSFATPHPASLVAGWLASKASPAWAVGAAAMEGHGSVEVAAAIATLAILGVGRLRQTFHTRLLPCVFFPLVWCPSPVHSIYHISLYM